MNLAQLARVYPSVFVKDADGVETTISLEWYDQNSKEVELLGFKLILLSKKGEKEELFFKTQEEMFEKLEDILAALENLKK